MKYKIGDRIKFIVKTGYYLMDRKMEVWIYLLRKMENIK